MIDCEKCREMISCLLDDELGDAERGFVREHIEHCPECQSVYDAFCTISEQMREPETLPEGLHEKIMSGVGAKPTKKTGIVWIKYLSAAACIALVIFAGAKSGILSSDNADNDAAGDMYYVTATAPVRGDVEGSEPENDSSTCNETQKQLAMSSASAVDEATADKLTALLEPVSPARGDTARTGEADYAVSLPDGGTVLIYIDGQSVYADFGDGAFLAVGSADDVRALLDK